MNPNAQKRQHILETLYQDRQAKASRLNQEQWTPIAELKNAVDDIDFYAGSQAPAWEPSGRSSSFARREAGASTTEFPSWSLGTSEISD